MDYRGEIVRMVSEIRSAGILRKLYRLTRIMWRSEGNSNDKAGNDK